jgi:hypothetical protein
MKIIDKEIFFSDAKVLNYTIDFEQKKLDFVVDFICYEEKDEIRFIDNVKTIVKGWNDFNINLYNSDQDKWSSEFDSFVNHILQFIITERNISINGFSKKSGLWCEIKITNFLSIEHYIIDD